MRMKDMDKNKDRKITIETASGEVEISLPHNQQPGFCPHCHKCIPLSSIVFKRMNGNHMEIYSGVDAVKEKRLGIPMGQNGENQSRVGECPYCHKAIPVREIIFKK